MNSFLPWTILLAPLISAVFITLFTLRWKAVSSFISIAAVLVSFACSCLIFTQSSIAAAEFTWINIGGALKVPLGFTLDQLSKTMLLVVSGVGATIHIYSLGYMRDDEGRSRYFAALSLFMFAMFGIVLANNFVMLFIFWELVGFTSYVLIGHWFFRDAAADAANKAFITTRIGDFDPDGLDGHRLHRVRRDHATDARPGKSSDICHNRRAIDLLRCGWQVGAVSVARLVT
jgi:NADH-quinone oxidoreductase subunit L